MVDEMTSLHKNEAWDLVEFPAGRKPNGNKWAFKKKMNVERKVEKYKDRLVEKDYSQVVGIYFGDIFSPVANVAFIRLILSNVVASDFEVEQMDVKTSFLHGDLEEEVYMKQPEGFAVKGKKELDLKTRLSSKFDMKDLGAGNYILGIEIKRDREKRKLWLNQRKYVKTILQRFNMQESKPVKVPIPVEIAHVVGVLSKFMSKLGKEHWTAVKRVFKYLHGTSDFCFCHQRRLGLGRVLDIHGFVDAN
eukprot:PITA_03056